MDWSSLAPTLVKLGAPLIAQAIGGPFGDMAGKILSQAFGATEPTPNAVNDAINKTDPAAASETAGKAESAWAAALAEIGKAQVSEVAQTMRAEAASEDVLQRWWRPIYALELSLFECPAFALVLGHGLWAGKAEILNGLANLSGLVMTYMAARFGVLGVYVTGRSREKQASLTGEVVPTILGELAKLIAKRK